MLNYLKDIFSRMKHHHIESFASQIAFYMLLSIFPFLILLLMFLTNLSLGYSEQMDYIYRIIPSAATGVIKEYLMYSQQFSNHIFSPVLIAALWMSSNAVVALMKSVNVAYDIEETRNYFKRKFIGILCTVLIIILIVVALAIPNLGQTFMNFIRRYIAIPQMSVKLFDTFRITIGVAVFIFVLGAIYFIVPNKKVTLREILPGTGFAFVGLTLTSKIFAYFVSEFSQYSLVYGGLAAVIILMIWLFLCGMILMLGGEINAINHGRLQKKKEI